MIGENEFFGFYHNLSRNIPGVMVDHRGGFNVDHRFLSMVDRSNGSKNGKNNKNDENNLIWSSVGLFFVTIFFFVIINQNKSLSEILQMFIPVIIILVATGALALKYWIREKVKQVDLKNKNELARYREEFRRTNEINEKKKNERQIIEKIRTMIKVSKRANLEMVRKTLEMDSDEFLEKIWGWAEKFGFIIDGDYIIVENADVNGFIKNLDEQFLLWGKQERLKEKTKLLSN